MTLVNKDMLVMEILQLHPQAAQVLARYGMACATCMGAAQETLEDSAKIHSVRLQELLDAINRAALGE